MPLALLLALHKWNLFVGFADVVERFFYCSFPGNYTLFWTIFLDVGLFAEINQLKCEEFQKWCAHSGIRSFFLHYHTNQKTYIICCRNFIKDCFQTIIVEKLVNRELIVHIGLMKMIAFAVLNILNCKNNALNVKWKL